MANACYFRFCSNDSHPLLRAVPEGTNINKRSKVKQTSVPAQVFGLLYYSNLLTSCLQPLLIALMDIFNEFIFL